MDSFFSFFGKLALVLIIVGILVTGGYYLGTGKLPFPTSPPPAAVTTKAPEVNPPTATTTMQPTAPSPPITMQTVSVASLSGTSFGGYTIRVPADWTVKKEETPNVSERVTITRDNYSLSIYQAATGGTQCVYPGETGGEMSTSFGPFVTLHDASGGEFRRATPTGNTSGFTVCQKNGTAFGLPTVYGHIGYSTPVASDPAILQEMDAIFATLKKS